MTDKEFERLANTLSVRWLYILEDKGWWSLSTNQWCLHLPSSSMNARHFEGAPMVSTRLMDENGQPVDVDPVEFWGEVSLQMVERAMEDREEHAQTWKEWAGADHWRSQYQD